MGVKFSKAPLLNLNKARPLLTAPSGNITKGFIFYGFTLKYSTLSFIFCLTLFL